MTESEVADYEEFGMLKLYADYEGIPWTGQPQVERRSFEVADGQTISALVWGGADPELVLLHGGGQNAHTWDSVAMALDRPLIAIDLPGHGHSDWRDDHDYSPQTDACAVAEVVATAAPQAAAVVGMSHGGLTNIRLAATWPDLVRRAVIVDIAPGSHRRLRPMTPEQRGTVALTAGPLSFESFEAMLDAAAATAPHRPKESLRTGVLHNARRLEDGTWVWRYDRNRTGENMDNRDNLWADFANIKAPTMLVRGGRSAFVQDEDEQRMRDLMPSMRVEVVDGAGHSVQSDRPVVLAGLISDFLSAG
jgi:pimeloyl-ACP methyl ester carboxylesterase